MIIIFLSLFFLVSNFYNVTIPLPHPGLFNSITGLIKKNKNEYVLVNNHYYSSYAHKMKIEYENIDITQSLKGLKEFLKLRDSDEVFYTAKENGYIGIPALVKDDGSLSLEWEGYFTEQGIDVVHPGDEGRAPQPPHP